MTSGDGFSGLEFAGFSGQKTEFGARQTREAGFRRKTSELGGSGTTFDVWHEKTNFSELAVFSAFCTKNGVVTKTGDIGKTFSWLKNLLFWSVLGPKITLELGYISSLSLLLQPTEHPLFPGSLLYVLYVLYTYAQKSALYVLFFGAISHIWYI